MNPINQNQFDEWLEHPVTEILHKFLKDSAKKEVELVTVLLMNGGRVSEHEQIRISEACLTLNQIAGLTLEDINEFYEKE